MGKARKPQKYGNCVGLMLTSWDYPKGRALKNRIDTAGLHPLTSLTTITKSEKSKLLEQGIVLCREIKDNPDVLKKVGIGGARRKKILADSQSLCKTHQPNT